MSDTAVQDAPAELESVMAASQAAKNAARFVVAMFEDLWETDAEGMSEIDLRAMAIEYGLVVENADQPDADMVTPELSSDLVMFIDAMSDGDESDTE